MTTLNDENCSLDDTVNVDDVNSDVLFLHKFLKSKYPLSPLFQRVVQLGDRFEHLRLSSGCNAANVTIADAQNFFTELITIATLGRSLCHLERYLDSPGLHYELKELSKIGNGENPAGDKLRLRGQGFLLLAASNLVSHGFDLEFISRRKEMQTPDFYAFRDGNKFTCEVTNRYPETGDMNCVNFFWSNIHSVVEKKRVQLQGSEFTNGVLIIDCSAVWEAFGLQHLPLGGEGVFFIPENLGGPRSVSAPIVRYDATTHSIGFKKLEEAIRGTNIQSLILWNHKIDLTETNYRQRQEYRILGTVHGCVFWSYFPKVCVFPGPELNIIWPSE